MDEALDAGTAAPEPAPPDPIPLLACQACGGLAVAKPRIRTDDGSLVWQPVCETPGCQNNPLTALRPKLELAQAPVLAHLPNRAARRHPR